MEIRQPAGYLDQMVRQTRAHHVQLSAMADAKANMMLTISAIVVPLSIRYLQDPEFFAAASIMICFCVVTIILAAYAAMPKLKVKQKDSETDLLNSPSVNPLFFGAFVNMSYPEYQSAMEEFMSDHNKTYEVQLREVFIMGQYLARRKYRYVRLAYI